MGGSFFEARGREVPASRMGVLTGGPRAFVPRLTVRSSLVCLGQTGGAQREGGILRDGPVVRWQ